MEEILIRWGQVSAAGVTKGYPEWLRTVGITPEGHAYVPLALTEREHEAHKRALINGASIIRLRGHPFVRADWLMDEYPDMRADLQTHVRRFTEASAAIGDDAR
jgi:hypothetical protein